jgi:acetyl esterase/lipase
MADNHTVVYLEPNKVEVQSTDFPKMQYPAGRTISPGVILKVPSGADVCRRLQVMKVRVRCCVGMAAVMICVAAAQAGLAQSGKGPSAQPVGEKKVYKTVDGREMNLWVSEPTDEKVTHPAIVFFHGGGWTGGSAKQFDTQSVELAARGMVAVDVEYRLIGKPPSTDSPKICVEDAKSAMRWVRSHAKELKIDPDRIASGGGSAGGYLAAAVDLVPGWDDPQDDLKVSPKPDAMALFFAVLDTSWNADGQKRFGEEWKTYSPVEYVSKSMPPTIILHGNADKQVPIATVENFKAKCDSVGAKCELDVYPGQGHAFTKKEPYRSLTMNKLIHFLVGIGWLPKDTKDVGVPAAGATAGVNGK